MKLFDFEKKKVRPISVKPFKLEKEIQDIVIQITRYVSSIGHYGNGDYDLKGIIRCRSGLYHVPDQAII
ncbi:MAG: hypothetical protein K9G38_02675 [Bacteroidales bacterium]|nr:hypothetical protein [Bacteroidales bacterium]